MNAIATDRPLPVLRRVYPANAGKSTSQPAVCLGVAFQAPIDWPVAQQEIFNLVEKSLHQKPEFRHLSVLPFECTFLVMEQHDPQRWFA